MISTEQLQELSAIGGTVIGPDGQKIGKFGQIFLDDRSGQPEWATVRTGLFGLSESFVPLSQATVAGDTLSVPYGKQTVKDAPNIDPEGQLTPEQEQELYHYYSLSYQEADQAAVQLGVPETDARAEYSREDVRDPVDGTSQASAIRSEERLHVGTESVETGRVRLRKHVVTENVATTVPVSHEEVRLEREPLTDAEATGTSGELVEDEQEVTLHEERPVVEKTVEPVERVSLEKETVIEEERLEAQLRKEQVQAEGWEGGRQTR
ncbi:YsnF/AvaK domain-containing protein [Glutamicibacter sp. NPDC087831]|uniref:YsnF/AvaK domain-containing protein n=1 Tax=Glutamicibacter sp. NPDC087831 TaxID=3363998 RepID=UPI00382DB158